MWLNIKGVIPAMLTPLEKDGSKVDFSATETLIDFLLGKGVNGLFILGSFGEGLLLCSGERKRFTEKVIDYVNRRVPVIVHATHLQIKKTKELIEHAQKTGADAVAVTPPLYYSFSDSGIENYFGKLLGDFKNVPVFIYNVPQQVTNEVCPTVLRNLSRKFPNFSGIKDSKPDLIHFQKVLALKGEMSVLTGCDRLDYPALLLGADGIVSGPANGFPEVYVRLYQAFIKKEYEKAKKIQQLINCICQKEAEIRQVNEARVPFYKVVLRARGVPIGDAREPLLSVKSLQEKPIQYLVNDVVKNEC